MKLHDSLTDAVADVSADVPTLMTAARRQGLALRRRRRVLGSVGATAAVAVLAGGGYAVATTVGHDSHTTPSWAAVSPGHTLTSAPTSGATAPLTGRSLTAALASAVGEVADGDLTEFRGAGGSDAMAEFLFAPRTDGVPGLVHLDLQSLTSYGLASSYGCDQPYMHDCASQRLPDGDTLRTYTDESSGSARAYRRYVAEVLSPRRDLRLILGATNTRQDEKHTVRDEPVLSTAQLRTVALQPWWSLTRLPAEYAAAGRRLPSYTGLNLSGD
jgi:hypothetical protein